MTSQYCRNCGKQVSPNAYACTNCGLPPLKGKNYCPNCGANTHPEAVICVKCGIQLESLSATTNAPNPPLAGSTDIFPAQRPKTWLVESILATLFCCLPLGIAGIVNASRVEARYYAGDYEGAQRASDEAKKWTMISFWIGVGILVIYLLLFVVVGISIGNGYFREY
jgi:hypothetical protein